MSPTNPNRTLSEAYQALLELMDQYLREPDLALRHRMFGLMEHYEGAHGAALEAAARRVGA